MVINILIIIFAFIAFGESITYGYYEIKVNQNKFGGISVMVLSVIAVVFALLMYWIK